MHHPPSLSRKFTFCQWQIKVHDISFSFFYQDFCFLRRILQNSGVKCQAVVYAKNRATEMLCRPIEKIMSLLM